MACLLFGELGNVAPIAPVATKCPAIGWNFRRVKHLHEIVDDWRGAALRFSVAAIYDMLFDVFDFHDVFRDFLHFSLQLRSAEIAGDGFNLISSLFFFGSILFFFFFGSCAEAF